LGEEESTAVAGLDEAAADGAARPGFAPQPKRKDSFEALVIFLVHDCSLV